MTGELYRHESDFEMFGHTYQTARMTHNCWCCGRNIEVGECYFRTNGKLKGRMFSVKHCRSTCECTAEMLDQNPSLRVAVFHPTIATWKALQ